VATTEPETGDADLVPNQASDTAESSDDELNRWLALAVPGRQTVPGTVVRKFVNTVHRVVPLDGAGLDKRREVIGAALDMTQRLAHAPYGLGRSFVQSTVLVNVDVDVDIASRELTTTGSNRKEV
jgi:hypothetical protein